MSRVKKICICDFLITDLTRAQLIPAAHKVWPSVVLWADVQAEELKLNTYTPTCHLQECGAWQAARERNPEVVTGQLR